MKGNSTESGYRVRRKNQVRSTRVTLAQKMKAVNKSVLAVVGQFKEERNGQRLSGLAGLRKDGETSFVLLILIISVHYCLAQPLRFLAEMQRPTSNVLGAGRAARIARLSCGDVSPRRPSHKGSVYPAQVADNLMEKPVLTIDFASSI
jgi:hypothetical protein